MRDWAVPVKAGADPFEDPWAKKGLEKKERVVRNKLAQVRGPRPIARPCTCIVPLHSDVGAQRF